MNVDIQNLSAWVDKMPSTEHPTLHVTGTVLAPTPCYEAIAKFTGFIDKTGIPDYHIEVEIFKKPVACPQVVSQVPFHYTEANFSGRSKTVVVKFGTSTASTAIKTVS